MSEPDAMHDPAGTVVEIRDLSIRAGGNLLLDRGSARFEPGEIALIIGPSGAGKSLLLRVMAGLVGPKSGEIEVRGEVLVGDQPAGGDNEGAVGVVFQSFALFDELSPLDNIRFAAAHRRPADRSSHAASTEVSLAERLLSELRVPRDVRTASLSGGQRQRLAIARTLAYNPQVILYDEPTSGLDAVTGGQVARLIKSTHDAHRKTSIIVTHDDRSLVPIADRVYLLDPATHTLRLLDRSEWTNMAALLHPPAAERQATPERDQAVPPLSAPGKVSGWLATQVGDFFVGTSRAVERLLLVPAELLPLWKNVPWGLRYFAHYLRLVAGPSAWVYVAVAGAITGFVSTYFTFHFLPFRSYVEPLVIEDLVMALGFAMYRILVPLLATILIAARCGAAVASDVGGKVYGQQIDALRTFGASPARYLSTNILYAFLCGTLVLVGVAFVVARLTSLVVFTSTHPHFGPFFWQSHFNEQLIVPGHWLYKGSGWLAAKLVLCAAGTALIAYDQGSRPKHSSIDVSNGITSTVLWATLYVLLIHLTFAVFEFEAVVPR
jgi:ABC-type transporter Mla maintaining outer membrane lipid asymmetry ATPase subunit MlaF/ABC-type transporter Mla maintaining outer membrane lipid asymmetry permease subunit MlaE